MNYIVSLFLTDLPFVTEEMRMVNGTEKRCLVIPTDEAQLVRSGKGTWCLKMAMMEKQPDAMHRTHRLSVMYRNNGEVEKAKRLGYYDKLERIGHSFIRDISEGMKKNRQNDMTPIVCTGTILLDDIKPEDITTDPRTGKRYVRFTFRKMQYLDDFRNSHELAVVNEYGEHQIGIAREWREATEQATRISGVQARINPQSAAQDNRPEQKVIPTNIDGYKF